MDFSRIIRSWYAKNRRDLPWRRTKDPYRVWLSEIILQQTRVAQGLAYYHAFTGKFPDVKKLAAAKEQEVLKLWQGLGYYSRARNLHFSAKKIVKETGGQFPGTYKDLLRLKGVGDYTAAAIASICFGEARPVVDGNVYRVLSRIFGIKTPIDSTEGKKIFRETAAALIDHRDPGNFNQALMEFGALQCVPRNPDCAVCPFVQQCEARKKNTIALLPVKAKKTKTRDRYFNYIVIRRGENVLLKKRTGNDIWKNMYDFPLVETEKPVSPEKLFSLEEVKAITGNKKPVLTGRIHETKHVLSHQNIHARFFEVKAGTKRVAGEKLVACGRDDLHKYPVPVIISRYLDNAWRE
ncbi:MAG TPA: A/G-specific adenine glycosylase [Bacteroidia bacterium]|nr:A/G-specific adenine glycosylase [Bacteroidia bacterium]